MGFCADNCAAESFNQAHRVRLNQLSLPASNNDHVRSIRMLFDQVQGRKPAHEVADRMSSLVGRELDYKPLSVGPETSC